jgi:hypothetical protein
MVVVYSLFVVIVVCAFVLHLSGVFADPPRPLSQEDRAEQVDARLGSAWASPMAKFALTHIEGLTPPTSALGLRGAHGGLTIEVHAALSEPEEGPAQLLTLITIDGDRVGQALGLCDRDSSKEWSFNKRAFEVAQTGDSQFDAIAQVQGSPAMASAALDDQTTEFLHSLFRSGWHFLLERGRITFALRDRPITEECLRTTGLLEGGLAAARRCSLAPDEVPLALAENTKSVRNLPMALRNLELLAQHYPDSLLTRHPVAAALAAKDPRVNLAGAMALPGPGPFRVCLKAVLNERRFSAEVRVRALHHLLDTYSQVDQSKVIAVALHSKEELLRLAAAEAVVTWPHAARLERLFASARQTVARRRALTRSEQALTQMLSSKGFASRLAAARALGVVGRLEAVEPLLRASRGLMPRRGVRDAARHAVRRIQERQGGEADGALSLAASGAPSGCLSAFTPRSP